MAALVSGCPLAVGEANVLWITAGRVPVATVFDTLPQARRAIKRTKCYARDKGYTWREDYRVLRLKRAND